MASIGNVALTASDLELEYRFELFLKGQSPATPPDVATLARVRDRLIEQRLLAEEAETTDIEQGDLPRKAAETLAEIRKQYASAAAFQAALQALGMDEQEVLKRLEEQELVLQIIDQHLRPAAWVERAEIEAYYQTTFVPQYAQRASGPAPALEEVENQIREILVQRKIDQLLQPWLQDLKVNRRVKLHSLESESGTQSSKGQ